MKAHELITKLQAINPDAEVIVASSNFELGGAYVPVTSICKTNDGSKKINTFRDAFDGGTYNKEIWSTFGGNIPVVLVS